MSVIIPCFENPETIVEYLPGIVSAAGNRAEVEFILVDAYHREEVGTYTESLGVIYGSAGMARRSIQMNTGATMAKGNVFFFLHLDSIPPRDFDLDIVKALKGGALAGCFRLKFSPTSRFLSLFAYFTRFNLNIARGGDQGLFMSADGFLKIGPFRGDWGIMEDIDMCRRLKRSGKFTIISKPLITSSRKYGAMGQYRLQVLFSIITAMYYLGYPNERLLAFYKKHIAK